MAVVFKKCDPGQNELFPPAVGDFLPEEHMARVFSEVIDELDVSHIARKYSRLGQRAYSPRMLLKVLFYGYAIGIRSSRKLADEVRFNVVFMWLAGRNTPDFRTISDFRKDHIEKIEGLFVQIVRVCTAMGMVKVGNWAIDGTKVKASANIGKSRTRDTIDAAIDDLRHEIANDLAEAERVDDAEDGLHGRKKKGDELPPKLRRKQGRLDRLEKAKQKLAENPGRSKANTTDPDAPIMKRKQGGGAEPAFNAQATVDVDSGVILAIAVGDNQADNAELVSQVDQATENVGRPPEKIVADAGYTSGPNLEAMEARGIEAYIPQNENREKRYLMKLANRHPGMIAALWLAFAHVLLQAEGKTLDDLPFDRSDFTFDADADHYRCPGGEILKLRHTKREKIASGEYEVKVYLRKTTDCAGCIFAHRCLKEDAKTLTIHRSEHEDRFQAMAVRLSTPEGEAIYAKRKSSVEPVFGVMKAVMGGREFLLRGLKKVAGEFALAAGAFNLRKILSHRRRQQLATATATG